MSWLEKVNTDYTITCGREVESAPGDNPTAVTKNRAIYEVLWLNATKHIDYNISEFVFKGIGGSLVKRGQPRGTQYNIEIYFQGDDNIDVANKFAIDAGFPLAWEIQHPWYGVVLVQPVSLTFDNSAYNITKVTGMVIETLEDNGVAADFEDPVTEISAKSLRIVNQFTQTYAADVPTPKVSDLQQIRKNLNGVYGKVSSMINGYQQDVDSYLNIYNDANRLVNTAAYDTVALISQTQKLIGTPAYFADTVVNRMNMFVAQLIILNRSVQSILDLRNRPTRTLKRLYENNAGSAIIGICLASILNIGNSYDYRPDVLRSIKTVIDNYNLFLLNLQRLQTLNGGLIDGYIPSADDITGLQQLVSLTVSTLFNISAGAAQERVKVLQYDTNVILLANELYGMQPDDSTITKLIANNNIGLNEKLILKQGRKIVYYV